MRHIGIFLSCILPLWCSAYTYQVGVIGDLTSIAKPAAAHHHYHYLISRDLRKQGYDIRVINYSSFTENKTDTLLPRFQKMIERDCPDILIIAVGILDALAKTSFDKVICNLSETIEYAQQHHIPVLLGSVDISAVDLEDKEYTEQFVQIYETWKNHPNVSIFPFLCRSISINFNYTEEHIFPTQAGHQFIAEAIKPFLIPLLDAIHPPIRPNSIEEGAPSES